MKKFGLFALVSLAGCAHPYTLDPLGGKPEVLNGIPLATAVGPKCVVQAGYQHSTPQEMLVKVRVMNKEKAPFDVDYSSFSMQGPPETVKTSPLAASEPDRYVKDLKATAETLDARTKMETFQGVEALGNLKGEESDAQIERAKSDYKRKVNEAEAARQQAEAVRKRIAAIEPTALRKTSVKTGETAEGALIFKAEFGETGVVTIVSDHPHCPAKLQFMLKK